MKLATPQKTAAQKTFGLTGGVASGKSTLAKILVELGALHLDADQVARDMRAPGTVGHEAIQARFQTTDPQELRALLSSDPKAKKDLEAILHPLILGESKRRLDALHSHDPEAPFILYEATLLIEAGRVQDFAGLIVVTAPEAFRLERLLSRDSISPEAAKMLIQSQNSDLFRLKHATHTIRNEGNPEQLRSDAHSLFRELPYFSSHGNSLIYG